MSIDIVRAGHPDCDRVAKLFDAYRQYYGQASDLDRASHFIGQRLAREESVILLATQSGTAVGFVQLYPSFSSVRTSKLWILNDLFVDPGARRKGVARALLLAAVVLALAMEPLDRVDGDHLHRSGDASQRKAEGSPVAGLCEDHLRDVRRDEAEKHVLIRDVQAEHDPRDRVESRGPDAPVDLSMQNRPPHALCHLRAALKGIN